MPNESDLSRRSFLVGTLGTALASSVTPAPGRAADAPGLTKADIDRMMKEFSNWGRWGQDDQMGTVNLITAAKRKYAASLVREGTAISLSHDLQTEKSEDNPQPLIHVMNSTGEAPEPDAAADTYTMQYHGTFYTHMDALSHQFYDGKMYNGYPANAVTSAGASKLDIKAYKNGIVTRGVLMDLARLKGVPYIEPGTFLYPADLDAWEKEAHVKVASGDMMLVRMGRWARRAEKGSWALNRNVMGLHASCIPWLKQRDVAVIGSDAVTDVHPSLVAGVSSPMHKLIIVCLGMPIFDDCDLEQLSEIASRLHRWEFMVTAAPLAIPGGTGSPTNPLAIF